MHDWFKLFHGNETAFPLTEVALKATIALSVGLLVGFEREWAQKDIGVRTFALTALLGLLAALVKEPFSSMAGIAVLILICFLNLRNMQVVRQLEATTSVALMIVFLLGALAGDGHLFTPVACAIVVTMLLSLKPQFHAFAGGLRPEEVRSGILLGLLGFVVWPLLPDRFVDPWSLFQPREDWVTVIVIASLGFINYILLRVYGSKGLYPTAILGGLVNSTATVMELVSSITSAGLSAATVSVVLLTSVAMFLRNLVILAVFSPASTRYALVPLSAMTLTAAFWAYRDRGKSLSAGAEVGLPLDSPVSLRKILKFASLFLAIQIVGTLAQRIFGSSGLQAVSLLGGLVSSAGTSAAAADLAMQGKVAASQAGVAVVLTSISSMLMDLPIVHRQVRDKRILRDLYIASALQAAIGITALLVQARVLHLL